MLKLLHCPVQVVVLLRDLYKVWLSSYFSFNREFSQFSCASAEFRTSVNSDGSVVVSDIQCTQAAEANKSTQEPDRAYLGLPVSCVHLPNNHLQKRSCFPN